MRGSVDRAAGGVGDDPEHGERPAGRTRRRARPTPCRRRAPVAARPRARRRLQDCSTERTGPTCTRRPRRRSAATSSAAARKHALACRPRAISSVAQTTSPARRPGVDAAADARDGNGAGVRRSPAPRAAAMRAPVRPHPGAQDSAPTPVRPRRAASCSIRSGARTRRTSSRASEHVAGRAPSPGTRPGRGGS